MPEVVTRKRAGRRSGGFGFKLNRWFYRNRPQVAVALAFAVFVLLGVIVASLSIKSSGSGPVEAESSAPG